MTNQFSTTLLTSFFPPFDPEKESESLHLLPLYGFIMVTLRPLIHINFVKEETVCSADQNTKYKKLRKASMTKNLPCVYNPSPFMKEQHPGRRQPFRKSWRQTWRWTEPYKDWTVSLWQSGRSINLTSISTSQHTEPLLCSVWTSGGRRPCKSCENNNYHVFLYQNKHGHLPTNHWHCLHAE